MPDAAVPKPSADLPTNAHQQAPVAIVFDCDGVLLDSMPLHAASYRKVLAPFGIEPTDEDVFEREGARAESIIEELLRAAGHAPTTSQVHELADAKQAAFAALGDPVAYPEAQRVVAYARSRAKHLGLVTGTRRENLDARIPELLPYFDVVLAQDSYHHDKPHPEPYARAAERLAVPVERCLAVENATRGVTSAKGAGYRGVCGITTTMPAQALHAAGATQVVVNHADLTSVIDRFCGLFSR